MVNSKNRIQQQKDCCSIQLNRHHNVLYFSKINKIQKMQTMCVNLPIYNTTYTNYFVNRNTTHTIHILCLLRFFRVLCCRFFLLLLLFGFESINVSRKAPFVIQIWQNINIKVLGKDGDGVHKTLLLLYTL